MDDQQSTGAQAPEANAEKASAEGKSALVDKWGKETIAIGYTVVPSILLRSQRRLGINANELAVLVHLMEHWWQATGMPWPSKRTIAERLDVHEKTVQRAAAKLEKLKLIKRVSRYLKSNGRTTNGYDLSLLVERLKEISIEVAQVDAEASKKKWKAHNVAPKAKKSGSAENEKAKS